MQTQFLVVGKNDDDCEAPLALLTRIVFPSYDEAKQYADEPSLAHRNPQVVECHSPIPSNLRFPSIRAQLRAYAGLPPYSL
jgi:hypothetical protein